jgi:iron complex transport system substrate-binding protein
MPSRLPKIFMALIGVVWPVAAVAHGIVSLNLCADQWVLLFAPARIAALTPLSRDPSLSPYAAQAQKFLQVAANTEAVLALHPDLVLAGPWGGRAAVAQLKAHHVAVTIIEDPQNFPAIRATIDAMARLLGQPAKANGPLAQMDADLASGTALSGHKTAVMWQARGLTAGPGTLGDSVLRAAGFKNIGTGGSWGLEKLLAQKPDLVVLDTQPAYPSLATDMAHNPALARLRQITLPPTWLACGGPFAARAVALLRGAR